MRYELNRGGQVYYVHNRIGTIDACYERLRNIVQHARIAIAHGRMPARQLEQVMLGFVERQYDILLSTSIVESGLDIPNVNTMIIEDADRFGLAQLYQLRGRVGREQCKAYSYMFYSRDSTLTDDARRRLESIAEFTELGSGLTLALRDMEIRGAGNLLGTQQHGRMMDVGFDLYMKILEGAVRELRGELVVESVPPQINLQIDAYIPVEYVESDGQRLALYRRLLAAKENEVSRIAEEIADRWGQMPQAMQNLIQIIRLRNRAVKLGVTRITQKDNSYVIDFGSGRSVKSSGLRMLVFRLGKQISFSSGDGLSIVWKPDKDSSIQGLDRVLQLLKESDIVEI
jgi:transcription-repair coupling factor (superfamily II helicase)